MSMVNKTTNRTTAQTGFTLIELMLATTFFAMVLVVVLASFLQIGRMYYKGVSITNTTDATRIMVNEVANDVLLSQSPPTQILPYTLDDGSHGSYFCVGSHRYAFRLDKQVTGITENYPTPYGAAQAAGVMLNNIGSAGSVCPAPDATNTGGAQELLGVNMQLNRLDFNGGDSCNTQVCNLVARVIYYGADNSVFISPSHTGDTPAQAVNEPDSMCSGGLLSTQFCAAQEFSVNVLTTI